MPTFEELTVIFQEKQGNSHCYLMDAHKEAEDVHECASKCERWI